ncbi:MAG: elongation factor 4 [bacterium]|nr:elongation factor 4 [bacterium]
MINQIRNFCIIAHVDHGKSTLADRLLEATGSIKRGQGNQVLDRHPISRERGITIKLAPVTMEYELNDKRYLLNLIDTPGHVDFSYEVERTLSAVEGAVLLVDATQGVQAQTVSYWEKAKRLGLRFIPVVNKIDLASARTEEVMLEMMELFAFREDEIFLVSAKTGMGVERLLQAVIEKVPPPASSKTALKALIFDSFYDSYKGVVAGVRLIDGRVEEGDAVEFFHTKVGETVKEAGWFQVKGLDKRAGLRAGEIGYLITGVKDIQKVRVGDTVFKVGNKVEPIKGFKKPTQVVFASFYPVDTTMFPKLKTAMEKLSLIDASLEWRVEQSEVLGGGVRCGFLGLLHAQITKERLERDYGLEIITTMPSVSYRYKRKNSDKWQVVKSAGKLPDEHEIEAIEEPFIRFSLFSRKKYYGGVMSLVIEARGKVSDVVYFGDRLRLKGQMPLSELVGDFYNQLETVASGFVSFDWEWLGWRQTKLKKVELLINGRVVEGLVFLFAEEKAMYQSRMLVSRLRKIIPRQQFEVVIQARVGAKIVARERIAPFRKDVTAKLYGGDQTRKDKLLKKQKKGKKRLKQIGKVQLPQKAFLVLLGGENT